MSSTPHPPERHLSLAHQRRRGLGVAAAVSVLGGALLVGDSVRGSLRDLVLSRLGRTGQVVSSIGLLQGGARGGSGATGGRGAADCDAGFITHEPSRRRAASVLVYGVDERFWRFHGLEPREGVFVSPALRAELGAAPGDVLLTRLQKPSEIPLESLFAHKEDLGRTVRLTVTGLLPPDAARRVLAAAAAGGSARRVRPAVTAAARSRRRRQVNTVLIAGEAPEADGSRALRSD